jgi:hypothetical protein
MSTYVDITEDLLEAIKAAWMADATLLAFLGELKSGRLVSPQTQPYAQVEVTKGKANEWMTGYLCMDYRNAKLTAWGNKADMTLAIQYMLAVFNLTTTLVLPSGDQFLGWRPVERQSNLVQDTTVKQAEDIWIGIVEAEIWTVRRT